jgi:hypothetical protein
MSKKKLLSSQIPDIGRNLTKFTGKELIDKVGNEVINEVVTSILCGGNVRALTEGLTQRRILISNASLFLTYLKGSNYSQTLRPTSTQLYSKSFLKID